MPCEYISFISGASVVIATILGLEWVSNVIDRVQVTVSTAQNRNKLIDELQAYNIELEAKIETLESKHENKVN